MMLLYQNNISNYMQIYCMVPQYVFYFRFDEDFETGVFEILTLLCDFRCHFRFLSQFPNERKENWKESRHNIWG